MISHPRLFRVTNNSVYARSQYVSAGLPFPAGEVDPAITAIHVATDGPDQILPFRTLERWRDGSVRRALVDLRIPVPQASELGFTYLASALPDPVAGFVDQIHGLLTVTVTVDGTSHDLSAWATLYESSTRRELFALATHGELQIRAWVTTFSDQGWGRLSVQIGNDLLHRDTAASIFFPGIKVSVSGSLKIAPDWQHAHGIVTFDPFRSYMFPIADCGDGARWSTRFVISFGDDAGAYADWCYPLVGYPDPSAENATRAYGVYGDFDATAAPLWARQDLDESAREWLLTCPAEPWGGNGFWAIDEYGTGGFSGDGPAPLVRADCALSPAQLDMETCREYTHARSAEHFSGFRHQDFPAVQITDWPYQPTSGNPIRPASSHALHVAGSHGWRFNPSKATPHHATRVHQLTGDPLVRDEILLYAHYAASTGVQGEGRGIAHTIERLRAGYFVGDDADRAVFAQRLTSFVAGLA